MFVEAAKHRNDLDAREAVTSKRGTSLNHKELFDYFLSGQYKSAVQDFEQAARVQPGGLCCQILGGGRKFRYLRQNGLEHTYVVSERALAAEG